MHSGLGIVREGATGYRNNENEDTADQDISNTPERSPRAQVCSVFEGLVHLDQGKGCSQLIPASLTGSVPLHHCYSATESQLQCSISSCKVKLIGKCRRYNPYPQRSPYQWEGQTRKQLIITQRDMSLLLV